MRQLTAMVTRTQAHLTTLAEHVLPTHAAMQEALDRLEAQQRAASATLDALRTKLTDARDLSPASVMQASPHAPRQAR